MKIETLMSPHRFEPAPEVESLESRVLGVTSGVDDGKRPDPGLDELYQKLLAMEGQGEKAIYAYLQSLRAADGVSALYPTARDLIAVTHQLLLRLKDEGLEKSQIFKEISGANGRAFNMSSFVMNYTREVMQSMGDDAWEKSEW